MNESVNGLIEIKILNLESYFEYLSKIDQMIENELQRSITLNTIIKDNKKNVCVIINFDYIYSINISIK